MVNSGAISQSSVILLLIMLLVFIKPITNMVPGNWGKKCKVISKA